MSADDSRDSFEALGELADQLARGGSDSRELAASVPEEQAENVRIALEALRESTSEDLPGDLPRELPDPELPADYEIEEEIGRGGMGVVYRARQRSLDRTIAIKVLRPGELLFSEAIQRFQNEAMSLARLKHRHIVSIHEVGEAGGNVFYSMDLIEGGSLAEHLQRDPWTPARVVRLMRQVTSAIAYTHGHDLIHRDLKPQNILLDGDGDAYVVDFGLARDCAVEGNLTVSGHILGTPDYMSPEQARGQTDRIGEATDIYALGAILYECLTRVAPFGGLPLVEKIHAVVNTDPVPVRKLNPRVPIDLETICAKAMAKEPERRYATARALLEDLERFDDGRPIRGKKASALYRTKRFVRNNIAAVLAVLIVTSVFAVAQYVFIQPQLGDSPSRKLEAARSLADAGVLDGAILRYEEGIELTDEGSAERRNFDRGLTYAQLARLADLARSGERDECERILEECRATLERIRSDCEQELGASAWKTQNDLALDRAVTQAFRGGALRHSMRVGVSSEERDEFRARYFDAVMPALFLPGSESHRGVVSALTDEFISDGRYVSDYFAGHGEFGLDLFVAFLEGAGNRDRWTYFGGGEYLASVMFRAHGQKLGEVVAPFAFDSVPRNDDTRVFAANLFAAAGDLPFRLEVWDEEFAREHLQRYATQDGVPSEETARFEYKVRHAIEVLHEAPLPTNDWLYRNVGGPIIGMVGEDNQLTRIQSRSKWGPWWDAHGDEGALSWLSSALELEEDSLQDRASLLRSFLEADGVRRPLFHRLLTLLTDSETPRWFYLSSAEEPDNLAMQWLDLDSSRDTGRERYRLRIAQFIGKPDGTVELVWEAQSVLGIGERMGLGRFIQTNERSNRPPGVMLDSLRARREWMLPTGGSTLGVDLHGRLEWRGADLGFAFGGHQHWGASGSGPNKRPLGFPSGAPRFLKVGSIGPIGTCLRRHETEMGLTLAVLEPVEADESEWGVAGWRARLRDDARGAMARFVRDGASLNRSRVVDEIAAPLWLLAFFAEPELEAELREHREFTRGLIERRTKEGFAGMAFDASQFYKAQRVNTAMALAVLGDASVATDLEDVHRSNRSIPYLLRLFLTSEDGPLRETALAKLEQWPRQSFWAHLGPLADRLDVTLSAEARERARSVTRDRYASGFGRSLSGFFALGVLLGLAGAATFRFFKNRPRAERVQLLTRVPIVAWITASAVVQVGLTTVGLAGFAWALGALAVFLITRELETRSSATTFLAVSALCSIGGEWGLAIFHLLSQVFGAFALVGLAGLHARLEERLDRRSFMTSVWPRHIVRWVALPGILVGVASQFYLSGWAQSTPESGRLSLDAWATLHLGAEILAGAFLLCFAVAGHAYARTQARERRQLARERRADARAAPA